MTQKQIEEGRELALAYIEANKVPEEMRDEVCSAYQAGRASVIFEMEEDSL